jgi:dinuclear metal center YbgI/SA1388 family protein
VATPGPTVGEVVDLVHGWYPPETAADWDAVGLAAGDPAAVVRRVLLAVDPVLSIAAEAAAWGADLLLTHHPLFLRGVHGVAENTAKGRTLATLTRSGCGLLTAHTNADQGGHGVSDAIARALGLRDVIGLRPSRSPTTGMGRVGDVDETTLGEFADRLARALPPTARGALVGGDLDRVVRRVAVMGGAGDELLPDALASGVDVYVTSDLRHHPASEFLEQGGPALVDVSHWAAEWMWLPELAERLAQALGDTVEVRVSTICTDVWQARR